MDENAIPQISFKLYYHQMIYEACDGGQQYSFDALLKMISPENEIGKNDCYGKGMFCIEYFFQPGKNKTMKDQLFIETANQQGYYENKQVVARIVSDAGKVLKIH